MKTLVKSKSIVNYLNAFPLSYGLSVSFRKYSTDGHKKSTQNEEEINKFRSFKDKDWWTDRHFAGLRQMNELRVPLIRDSYKSSLNTSKPLNGIKLLDIGCGAGILSEPLARLGAEVTGIDPVMENIEMALNHSKDDKEMKDNIHYESVSIEEMANRDQMIGYFDGVIASEVIEHIDNIDLFLTSSLKCLKKGGNLFISTINQTPIALFMAIFMSEYVLSILPKGTHQYNKFVGPQALAVILGEHDCSVSLIHGMGYNPLTGRWFWTQNQCINYALKAVKN